MKSFLCIVCIVLSCLLPAQAFAQPVIEIDDGIFRFDRDWLASPFNSATISGTVRDASTGLPMSGVNVACHDVLSLQTRDLTIGNPGGVTGSDGRFEMNVEISPFIASGDYLLIYFANSIDNFQAVQVNVYSPSEQASPDYFEVASDGALPGDGLGPLDISMSDLESYMFIIPTFQFGVEPDMTVAMNAQKSFIDAYFRARETLPYSAGQQATFAFTGISCTAMFIPATQPVTIPACAIGVKASATNLVIHEIGVATLAIADRFFLSDDDYAALEAMTNDLRATATLGVVIYSIATGDIPGLAFTTGEYIVDASADVIQKIIDGDVGPSIVTPMYSEDGEFSGITASVCVDTVDDKGLTSTQIVSVSLSDRGSTTAGNTIDFAAAPSSFNADGQSAQLTAVVTDSSGNPVTGESVTITKLSGSGDWVDVTNTQILSVPNNGLTDALGRSRAYFRPDSAQTATFRATIADGSDDATFTALPVPDTNIQILCSQRTIGDGYADYEITAEFLAGTVPIDHGTARFTTDFGFFTNGSNPGQTTTEEDIETFGTATVVLRVPSSGTANICAEYVEGNDIGCLPCVVTDEIPETTPYCLCLEPVELNAGYGIDVLSSGGHYLAALSEDEGLTLWDMRDLSIVNYWDSDVFSNAIDDWDRSIAIDVSSDGNRVVLAGWEDVGVFNTFSPYSAAVNDDPARQPSRAVTIHNNGQIAGWSRNDNPNGGDSPNLYQTSGAYQRTLCGGNSLPDGTLGIDMAFSPNGDLAYTYRDGDDRDGYLVIVDAPNYTQCRGPYRINSGSRPGGIGWSPDGSKLAVSDGDGAIRIYSDTGNLMNSFATISRDAAGSVEWSPDGTWIAAGLEGGRLEILNASTGQLIAVCNANFVDTRNNDELAWSSDSQLLFAVRENSNCIRVFAPFDTDAPNIHVLGPSDGELIFEDSVSVVGTIIDDLRLLPDGTRWRINGGQWTPITPDFSGNFSFTASLVLGNNTIEIEASDLRCRISTHTIDVEYLLPPAFLVASGGVGIEDGESIDLGTNIVGQNPASMVSLEFTNVGGTTLTTSQVSVPQGVNILDVLVSPLAPLQTDSLKLRLDTSSPIELINAPFMIEFAELDGPFEVMLSGVVIDSGPCSPADTAEPYGELNFLDVSAFLQAYSEQDPAADLVQDGMFNFLDVSEFLLLYGMGCP